MLNESDVLELLVLNGVLADKQQQTVSQNNNNLRVLSKKLRDTIDPFTVLNDRQFKKQYRLTKTSAEKFIDLLSPVMQTGTASRFSVKTRILIALKVFATGGYQHLVGQDVLHPSCQASVSNCFTEVVDALNEIAPSFIKFPKTPRERWNTQRKFRQYNRIPGILGLIDCVVIKFLKPHENEECFYNFKHGHVMKVKIVCDSDHMITDVTICLGSNNDQGIWNNSNVKDYMEQLRNNPTINREEGKYYLLGDSGYTASPILLTPVHDAEPSSPEAKYTREHCGTRCRIEQLFGIWLNVWRILKRERTMRYAPKKVAKIIVASAVLHNFRLLNGISDDTEDDEGDDDDDDDDDDDADYGDMEDDEKDEYYAAGIMNYQRGILERAEIIDHLYT